MHSDDERELLETLEEKPDVTVDLTGDTVAWVRGRRARRDDLGSVQFLRSRQVGNVITSGRFALATSGFGLEAKLSRALIAESEKLFRYLRAHIKAHYTNRIVCWHNPTLPKSSTNPSKPDASTWVGPHALRWWRAADSRKLKQFVDARVECVQSPGEKTIG